jgi:3-methylcrotonyl-CoA carboxylase alpha subunit
VTNLAFLLALARHPGFASALVDTGLIARDLEDLCRPTAAPEAAALAAAILLTGVLDRTEADEPWDRLSGFRIWGAGEVRADLHCGDRQVEVRFGLQNGAIATQDGDPVDVRMEPGAIVIGVQGRLQRLRFRLGPNGITIFAPGHAETYTLVDPLLRVVHKDVSGNTMASPMPGMITLVHATPGQTVAKGELLVVVEAMKMEHAIRAPRDGIVAEVPVAQGQQVGDGDILIVLRSDDG